MTSVQLFCFQASFLKIVSYKFRPQLERIMDKFLVTFEGKGVQKKLRPNRRYPLYLLL